MTVRESASCRGCGACAREGAPWTAGRCTCARALRLTCPSADRVARSDSRARDEMPSTHVRCVQRQQQHCWRRRYYCRCCR
eukprot:3430334-Pleurochrysis_carterae.AAC.1